MRILTVLVAMLSAHAALGQSPASPTSPWATAPSTITGTPGSHVTSVTPRCPPGATLVMTSTGRPACARDLTEPER